MTLEEKLRVLSREDYGASYGQHLLEQYKLYVEMADRISQRRQIANGFCLSINTAMLGIVGLAASRCTPGQVFVMIGVISLAGILTTYGWYRLLCSYRDLNTAKFAVIHAIEAHLPIAPYAAEWVAAGEGKNPRFYKPFSHIEVWIPRVFMVVYVVALIYCIVALIVQRTSNAA